MPHKLLACAVFLVVIFGSGHAAETTWAGKSLRNYVESLKKDGLRVIYSSDLVLEEYVVVREPDQADPVAALKAALSPYGLTIVDGPAGSLLISSLSGSAPPGHGSIRVTVTHGSVAVAGASVILDGVAVGQTDSAGELFLEDVTAGSHRVSVSADGFLETSGLDISVPSRSVATIPLELYEDEPQLAEIIVTASHYSLEYEDPEFHTALDRDLIARLPNIGDEAVRAIAKLPGTANGGFSARSHVRGGEVNEVLFLLDGLRLYEPYHLKDFQTFVTIVNQGAISGIDFYAGGYPARYGDRMSGVMDIGLRQASGETETELALSFFNTSVLSIGNFAEGDRGDWMISARRGNLDYILDVTQPDTGGPKYNDMLTHVGWEWTDRTRVSVNFLASRDEISVLDADDSVFADARYDNRVLWLKSETNWRQSIDSQTIVSISDIDNYRSGVASTPGIVSGTVENIRTFDVFAVKQDWRFLLSPDWMMRAGFDYKDLKAAYRYVSEVSTEPPFDELPGNEPVVIRDLEMVPRGSQYAAYVETRWKPLDRLTLDAGVRWDEQTYTIAAGDTQFSPRLSVLYTTPQKTEVRLGWGQFYQAQEINELQISDGIVKFYPAQRAKHLVASVSHLFSNGLELRTEAYRKSFRLTRPRFENLFDPHVLIPELEPDRVRIDVNSASARGVELSISGGDEQGGLLWWTSYGWAEIRDEAGNGNIVRSWDQTHSFKAGINWLHGPWSISGATAIHTGWPKTELLAESVTNPDGSERLALSTTRRNSLRYSNFASLDFRISRDFDFSKGRLTGFLEITNVLNRNNPCCLEYSIQTDSSGSQSLQASQQNWLPLVPSLGIIWRF
jgi:outer membrane receptor protein involved in Fe transport